MGSRNCPSWVLLTPLKMSDEAAKKCAEPYTQFVEDLQQMRRETVHLVRQDVSKGRPICRRGQPVSANSSGPLQWL